MSFFTTPDARKTISSTFTNMIVLMLVLLCIGIPSIESSTLMKGTQSGKSIFFILGMEIVSVFFVMLLLLKDTKKNINLSIIDFLLFTFIAYIILWNDLIEYRYNLLFLELIALSIFYIILKFLDRKFYRWILTGIMIGGLIQAVYGNLQLWGYFRSNHSVFKMTGSFFNPGPYAGYLAAIFPLALGFYLFDISFIFIREKLIYRLNLLVTKVTVIKNCIYFSKNYIGDGQETEINSNRQKSIKFYPLKFLPLLTLVFVGLVLPASRSRAAWLAVMASSIYLFSIKYHVDEKLTYWFNSWTKKFFILILAIVLIIMFFSQLYFIKKGSADGRLLIWKISWEMIKNKPMFGTGYDGFKQHYMNYQANYFRKFLDEKETMVAGDPNYAFDEIIQVTVENGLVGLILGLGVIYFIFYSSNINLDINKYGRSSEKFLLNSGLFRLNVKFENDRLQVLHITKATFLSVMIFALFSYPFQILPIKICLTACLAIYSSLIFKDFKIRKDLKKICFYSTMILIISHFILFYWITLQVFQLKTAYKDWKDGYDLYRFNIYEKSIIAYKKSYPYLKQNGDFLTNYGKALALAEKYGDAVEVLQYAARYYPNTVVYTAIGDSYRKLKMSDQAERAYINAWYMNPSHFYPKYLLAKMYNETEQKEKACMTAKEIIDKKIKIESIATKEIRDYMKKIIDNMEKLNNSNPKGRTGSTTAKLSKLPALPVLKESEVK